MMVSAYRGVIGGARMGRASNESRGARAHHPAACPPAAVSQIAEMRRLADKLRDDERVILDLETDRIREYLQAGSVTRATVTNRANAGSVPTQRVTETSTEL